MGLQAQKGSIMELAYTELQAINFFPPLSEGSA